MTMRACSIFLASNHIKAADLGLQAQGWPPRGTLAPGAQSLPGKEFGRVVKQFTRVSEAVR
jgi:hypothetical protein